MRERRPGAGGFTLIEVVVVIAVISILAAMAVPYAVKILDQAREESTKKQMEEIHRAVLGDPRGPTAGFLGDMGRLPGAVTELNTPPAPLPQTTGMLGVKFGWYGPYVKIGYSAGAYLVDGWGRSLLYNNPGAGQIRSDGPDRTPNTPDDIVYPSSLVVPAGQLLVNLYVWRTDNTSQYVLNPKQASFPPMQMDVRMYYSANGVQAFKSYTGTPPPSDPPYIFSPSQPLPAVLLSTHAGFHAVTATCTLPPNPQVSGQAVVYIPENGQQTVLNLYLR